MTAPSEKNFAARRAEESHSWPPSGHHLLAIDLLARIGHMTDHPSELSTFLSFCHCSSRAQRTSLDCSHSMNCLVWAPQWCPAWLLYYSDSVFLVIRVHGSHHCSMSPCIQNSVVGLFLSLLISAPQGGFLLHLLQIQNGAILVITAKWNWGNYRLCHYS